MTKYSDKQGFLLGIDTGTSKTHALISDLNGNIQGFSEAGCGNYEVVGISGFRDVLINCADIALKNARIDKTEILSMGFGFSGYDWPSEKQLMTNAIKALNIPSPYQFVNDVVIGLIAGAPEGWGVAVDAGTGNNVRGRTKSGIEGRITGNSIYFGELGGAGEIVWIATLAVAYAWSQRGPKTRLTQLFIDHSGAKHEEELIEGLAMNEIHLLPVLAVDIIHLAVQGDPVSKEVVARSAKELGLNVNAVIRQLRLQNQAFPLILLGSLFKAGEIYLQPFLKEVHSFAPQANPVTLTVPPVVGAVLLAAETIAADSSVFREKLMTSSKAFFKPQFIW